jgi:hypothetical protein
MKMVSVSVITIHNTKRLILTTLVIMLFNLMLNNTPMISFGARRMNKKILTILKLAGCRHETSTLGIVTMFLVNLLLCLFLQNLTMLI